MSPIQIAVLGLLLGLLVLSQGFGPPPDDLEDDGPLPSDDVRLQAELMRLTRSSTPEATAERLQLDYREGRVHVVVELESEGWIPDARWAIEVLNGVVDRTVERRVQAWVPPEALLQLARHPRIAYVRAPVRPTLHRLKGETR